MLMFLSLCLLMFLSLQMLTDILNILSILYFSLDNRRRTFNNFVWQNIFPISNIVAIGNKCSKQHYKHFLIMQFVFGRKPIYLQKQNVYT